MKKIFVLIAAIFALASCSYIEDVFEDSANKFVGEYTVKFVYDNGKTETIDEPALITKAGTSSVKLFNAETFNTTGSTKGYTVSFEDVVIENDKEKLGVDFGTGELIGNVLNVPITILLVNPTTSMKSTGVMVLTKVK